MQCHQYLAILYSAIFRQGKTLANRLFQSVGKENFGRLLKYPTFSYCGESRVCEDKTLAKDIHFTKFAKAFPCQNFVLYGN